MSRHVVTDESGDVVLLVLCSTCKGYKPPDEIVAGGRTKSNSHICYACVKRARNLSVEQSRAQELKKHYRITVAEYDDLFAKQGGVCAICQRPPHGRKSRHLFVDHDHQRHLVRGLLCHTCNVNVDWAMVYAKEARRYIQAFYERFDATMPEHML